MNYFKAKSVIIGAEGITFDIPDHLINEISGHYMYHRDEMGYEIHGVACNEEQVKEILSHQSPEIECVLVEYAQIENTLKSCRWYREIDARTVSNIQKQYDINKEVSIIKLGSDHPQYIEMQDYIQSCRLAGHAEKVAIGLKLSDSFLDK